MSNTDIKSFETFNNLSYPIVILDDRSNIVWINKKAKSLISDIKIKELFKQIENKYDKKIVILNNIFYEINESNIKVQNLSLSILSFFNISKRKKLEEKLINSEKMFKSLSVQLPEAVLVCNEKIVYSNPAFEKMLGFSNKYFTSKSFYDLLDEENRILLKESLEYLISSKKSQIEFMLFIKRKNGDEIWIDVKTKAVIEEKNILYINVIKDVTSSKIERENLERLANTDLLTNIYNRRKFQELFDREYKRSKRYESQLSLIFFDIDHFKKINDTFGHDVGDMVLREVSSIVSEKLRETDIFARWGGEEFIILLPETNSKKAYEVAENIRITLMKKKFKEVEKVTISLGVTQLKKELQKSFLKRVDLALYKAKYEGRNISIVV